MRDSAKGLLILFLVMLLPFPIKSVMNDRRPSEDRCNGKIFVQIEGDIRNPGVYPFCRRTNLAEVIGRGGGLKYNAGLPRGFTSYPIESGTKAILRWDGKEWRLSQERMSSFHRITLGIRISVNEESEEGLTALPGIGPGLARKIVRERDKRGRFRDIEEIRNLSGIGNKIYKKIVPYVKL